MRISQSRLIPLDYASMPSSIGRKEFAEILGMHVNSIYTYSRIAKGLSPEYLEDLNQYRLLTKFMCWCLWHIQYKFAEFPHDGDSAKRELRKNRKMFTRSKFQQYQRQTNNAKKYPIGGNY